MQFLKITKKKRQRNNISEKPAQIFLIGIKRVLRQRRWKNTDGQ
jgi:hypothetical protein